MRALALWALWALCARRLAAAASLLPLEAEQLRASVGGFAVMNCHLDFPFGNEIPYHLQWDKDVSRFLRLSIPPTNPTALATLSPAWQQAPSEIFILDMILCLLDRYVSRGVTSSQASTARCGRLRLQVTQGLVIIISSRGRLTYYFTVLFYTQ